MLKKLTKDLKQCRVYEDGIDRSDKYVFEIKGNRIRVISKEGLKNDKQSI